MHGKLNRLLVLQHTRSIIMKYLYEIFMQQTDISRTCTPSIWLQTPFKIFKILKIYAMKDLYIELHMSLNKM